jgi:hypothetical protein
MMSFARVGVIRATVFAADEDVLAGFSENFHTRDRRENRKPQILSVQPS